MSRPLQPNRDPSNLTVTQVGARASSTLSVVKVGIHFFNQTLSGGPGALPVHLRDTAEAAEEAGCTMFTCMDHYFQMEQFTRAEDPMLEGYTTLGYVTGRTQTMTLGLLVTGVSYRYPGLLAKIVTTLDVLSGGRAMLGIARRGTSESTSPSESPSIRSRSDSSRSRRRSRSAYRCGASTTAHTRESTIASRRR